MSDLVEQLRTIEESLRDRAYDALRAAAKGDESAAAAEKKILQARRGIEKAIRALEPISSDLDEGP
ncbi:MAG: hypothetical protein ABJC79_12625 [Acidimicrobiia bacterium]